MSASEYRPFTVVFVGEYLITYIRLPVTGGGRLATPFGVAPAGFGAVGAESIIACVLAAALFVGASGMGTPWGGGGGGPFVGAAGAGAGGLLAMAAAS
mgnify:CR=1 FL=1